MKSLALLAGAAALGLTAPALAKPDKGGGNPAKGGGSAAKVERGGGGNERAERREFRQQQQPERREARQQQRVSRADREVRREARADRREFREVRGQGRAAVRQGNNVDRRILVARGEDRRELQRFTSTGRGLDCPPGLAAKGNGCLPPGQARKLVGAAVPAVLGSALLPPLVRGWYPDDENYFYRTSDGYVYRIDRERNLVDAFWPLSDGWDGDYAVGAAYPRDYLGYYNVPVQYRSWYADGDENVYRYGDGAIYRIDRDDGLITAVVSLLAGGLGVGQPLPAGYDVYNLPFEYRDRYVDSDEAWYRYGDGQIYRVDPTTRIVEAIVASLA